MALNALNSMFQVDDGTPQHPRGVPAPDHPTSPEIQLHGTMVAVVLTGGYRPDLEDTVELHLTMEMSALEGNP